MVCFFVCVNALHPSQQFFSHVGMFSCLHGLTSTKQRIKVSCLRTHHSPYCESGTTNPIIPNLSYCVGGNYNIYVLEVIQGSHRLEKYLNLEGFLEKSLKIKSALKITGKSLKGLERSLNSTIFCRTQHC